MNSDEQLALLRQRVKWWRTAFFNVLMLLAIVSYYYFWKAPKAAGDAAEHAAQHAVEEVLERYTKGAHATGYLEGYGDAQHLRPVREDRTKEAADFMTELARSAPSSSAGHAPTR